MGLFSSLSSSDIPLLKFFMLDATARNKPGIFFDPNKIKIIKKRIIISVNPKFKIYSHTFYFQCYVNQKLVIRN